MKRKYTTPNMRIVPFRGSVLMLVYGSNTVSTYQTGNAITIGSDEDTTPSPSGSSRENIFIGEDEDE